MLRAKFDGANLAHRASNAPEWDKAFHPSRDADTAILDYLLGRYNGRVVERRINLASSLEFRPSSFHQAVAVTHGPRNSMVRSFPANVHG